jgi:MFS superfamily sulfate permease-like transporter
MIVVLGDFGRGQIPMAALVAIMIMVSIGTFSAGPRSRTCVPIRAHPPW